MSFWNQCWHPETTPADENGEAICTECGAVVTTTLTRSLMERTFEMVRRDYGDYGRHSMDCVDTEYGWVCAPDCTLAT